MPGRGNNNSEIAALRAMLTTLQNSLDEINRTVAELRTQLQRKDAENAELKRIIFGKRSERIPTPKQEIQKRARSTETPQPASKSTERKPRGKAPNPHLPVEEIAHGVSCCPTCRGTDLVDLKAPEVSDEVEFVPARFVRRRHARAKVKCRACQTITTAPAPKRVTDGCAYGVGLHAHAVVTKCADAIPLHRLAKRFERDGLSIERSTLTRMFHRTAELLAPIAKRILALVAAADRVNADETPILIQAPEKCRRGYVWTFLTDGLIAYVFSKSRSGQTPLAVLGDTRGTLQVDAFSGYNVVCVPEGRTRAGCLSHVRRKFFEALESTPDDARAALDLILALYEVEYEAARLNIWGSSQHLALRRTASRPRMDKLMAWLAEREPYHPPKSPMGAAIRYARSNVPTLDAIFDNAKIRLDNNLAENALRIVAVGRKNFLFVGHEEGGENLATLLTVVSTCKANGINPEAYIADVISRLDETPASRIDELLPANWKPLNTDA